MSAHTHGGVRVTRTHGAVTIASWSGTYTVSEAEAVDLLRALVDAFVQPAQPPGSPRPAPSQWPPRSPVWTGRVPKPPLAADPDSTGIIPRYIA